MWSETPQDNVAHNHAEVHGAATRKLRGVETCVVLAHALAFDRGADRVIVAT